MKPADDDDDEVLNESLLELSFNEDSTQKPIFVVCQTICKTLLYATDTAEVWH